MGTRSLGAAVVAAALLTGGVFVLAGEARAAEPASGEPSIEEMLGAIEAARSGTGGAPAAAAGETPGAAASPKPAPGKTARRGPVAARKPPPDVEAEIKAVKARGSLIAGYYQKHRKLYHLGSLYMKFDNHKQAVRVFAEMLKRRNFNVERSPVPHAYHLVSPPAGSYFADRYLEQTGYFESVYARSLASLGEEAAAKQMLGKASAKRAQGSNVPTPLRGFLQRAQAFVAGLPEAKAGLDKLEATLAETPDGDTQWEIAEICSPAADRVVKPIRWLESLLVMVDKHPDHPNVSSGLAHWRLFQAYREFSVHERCVEVLDRLRGKHPELHLSKPGMHVTAADALWEKAESYVRLGLMKEELGDRRAVETYRAAVECFESFKKEYPEHPRSKPQKSEGGMIPAMADRRIQTLYAAINRSSK